MTTDELVRQALRDLTENVRPEPEPAARARRRLRRSQRRRRIGVSLAGVLAVGAGWAAAPSVGDQPTLDLTLRQVWSQRMYEAEPRGGVAIVDPAFVQALGDQVQRVVGRQMPHLHLRAPRVLYVDDIGAYRVAIVAFEQSEVRPTGSAADSGSYATATYMAARGADAVTLANGFQRGGLGLAPLFSTELTAGPESGSIVALAPPGCTIATAAPPQLTDWQPAATGSYLALALDKAGPRPQWWRVTCDGVVRQETPARRDWFPPVSDEVLAQASKDVRGSVNHELAGEALTDIIGSYSYHGGGGRRLPRDSGIPSTRREWAALRQRADRGADNAAEDRRLGRATAERIRSCPATEALDQRLG